MDKQDLKVFNLVANESKLLSGGTKKKLKKSSKKTTTKKTLKKSKKVNKMIGGVFFGCPIRMLKDQYALINRTFFILKENSNTTYEELTELLSKVYELQVSLMQHINRRDNDITNSEKDELQEMWNILETVGRDLRVNLDDMYKLTRQNLTRQNNRTTGGAKKKSKKSSKKATKKTLKKTKKSKKGKRSIAK
jgi:hypothetical protein